MGDLAAVGTAFDLPRLAGKQQSKKFRNPDALANAQEELKKFRRACLTPHEHNLSLEASEDDRETALCHRKYESLEQKYLHYLTEPLRDDNGTRLVTGEDGVANVRNVINPSSLSHFRTLRDSLGNVRSIIYNHSGNQLAIGSFKQGTSATHPSLLMKRNNLSCALTQAVSCKVTA